MMHTCAQKIVRLLFFSMVYKIMIRERFKTTSVPPISILSLTGGAYFDHLVFFEITAKCLLIRKIMLLQSRKTFKHNQGPRAIFWHCETKEKWQKNSYNPIYFVPAIPVQENLMSSRNLRDFQRLWFLKFMRNNVFHYLNRTRD